VSFLFFIRTEYDNTSRENVPFCTLSALAVYSMNQNKNNY
jgi:hypothetical protein